VLKDRRFSLNVIFKAHCVFKKLNSNQVDPAKVKILPCYPDDPRLKEPGKGRNEFS